MNSEDNKEKNTIKCLLPGRLEGKIALVTGANGTIGQFITMELARRGAIVYMICVDENEGQLAKDNLLRDFGKQNKNALDTYCADESLKKYFSHIESHQVSSL